MYKEERRKIVLNLLEEKGSIGVNDLAEMFHVSGSTIRQDLHMLETQGNITRTHGGAVLSASSSKLAKEAPYSQRKNQREKTAIARKALDYVGCKDILLLDTGTTMWAFARELVKADKNLMGAVLYSNDLAVLQLLEEREDLELHMLGGRIRNGYHYTYGQQMKNELSRYHFPKLFLAASALSGAALTTSNSELAMMKRAMIDCSKEVYLLMDSSKINHVTFQEFGRLSDITLMITDGGISESDASRIRKYTELVIATED